MILTADEALGVRPVSRWLIGLVMVMLSFVALIASAEKLQLPNSHLDDLLTDHTYKDEIEWRTSQADENAWRAGEQNQKQGSRIQFGYDSAYEELRARDYDENQASGIEYDRIKPNTTLRIGF